MNKKFSYDMHDQTERPGQLLPQDAHNIIRHRYEFAAKLSQNMHVLEIGAGHGVAARMLSQRSASYVAGEYSDENIALLQQRKDLAISFVQFDAHQLPFKPRSFDVVMTMAMIYYLDFEKFLEQVKSVLKPGGKLIFCTSNKAVPGFVAAPYTKSYYTVPELNHILYKNGFKAEFMGAFLAPGGSYLRRRVKALVKNTMKTAISLLPKGKKIWQNLRAEYAGKGVPLPWNVEEIKAEEVDLIPLLPDKVNKDFRIIYSEATLSEQETQNKDNNDD